MDIGKILMGGVACGLFTTTAIVIPIATTGLAYGCVEIIRKIKEHNEYKKTHIIIKPGDYTIV